MNKLNNPFVMYGYKGKDYFCDRKEETRKIISSLQNENHIALISPRRMGKTGLIQRVFEEMKETDSNSKCFYLDIYSTKNLGDFVNLFAQTVIGELDSLPQKALRIAEEYFSRWRPKLEVDPITGMPSLSLDISEEESEKSLAHIFQYIKESGCRCYIAIDEFQQVTEYPEKNTEALLRSYIQFLPNAYFIFSGSKQHMLGEMFLSAKRPFFQGARMMNLESIIKKEYIDFANSFYVKQGRTISEETFDYIYNVAKGVTWYIQSLLHTIYEHQEYAEISIEQVKECLMETIENQDSAYQNYCYWLTNNQLKLLKAIAKENFVTTPFAATFVKKHGLGGASSVKVALGSLVDKQLVYNNNGTYSVYDIFFQIWLNRGGK